MVATTDRATMPDQLAPLWDAVEAADEKRHDVQRRIDAYAAEIATTRRRLNEASDKDRDVAAADLAGLRAEATVLPTELEDACDNFAAALHEWAEGGLLVVKEIEARGRRESNQAGEDAQDELTALDDGEHPNRKRDRTAIAIAAGHRAERAEHNAAKEARTLLKQLVDVTKVDGRTTSIFRTRSLNTPARRSFGAVEGEGKSHASWLREQRQSAEQTLADAR